MHLPFLIFDKNKKQKFLRFYKKKWLLIHLKIFFILN